MLQLEIPIETVIRLIGAGKKAGVPVILNLAPAQPLPWEVLAQLAVLIVNETEASLLSGQRVETPDDARIVATVLHENGIPTVIITLGAQGALLVTTDDQVGKSQHFHQPAPAVQVIDTTAGGDCFVGAFTVALTEGQSPRDALRFAVYASALKVTKFGAQSGLPTRSEVEAFLKGSGRREGRLETSSGNKHAERYECIASSLTLTLVSTTRWPSSWRWHRRTRNSKLSRP